MFGGNTESRAQADITSFDASEEPVTSEQQSERFPACMNVEVHRDFLAKMDEERKKIWGDDVNYWCEL